MAKKPTEQAAPEEILEQTAAEETVEAPVAEEAPAVEAE